MSAENHANAPLNPGLIFGMMQAHQQTAALRAAIELDIFTAGKRRLHCPPLFRIGTRNPHPVRLPGDLWRACQGERALQTHSRKRDVP